MAITDKSITAKEFLFQNQDITLQIDNGPVLDMYSSEFSLECGHNNVLTLIKNDEKYELVLTKNWQRFEDTSYYAKVYGCGRYNQLLFLIK